ncbi:MAG TPA: ABC transporter substrate-binding protein [Burkholderiaceae bacterium]|nr:ABC transporter substrate-binding protein [Burkholderiaceae bacterium]
MNRSRRQTLAALAAAPLVGAAPRAAAQSAARPKVLRYAFPIAETGFDPAQLTDLYSRIVTAHIFDGLYTYDHLARPFKIKPNTAAAMPEVSPDFRTWTVRLRPGIYFADDPAFEGRKRELVAADYVYSLKRFADPRWKAPAWASVAELKLLGLNELREEALKNKRPFDYSRDIEGLRALDRYTLQFRCADPAPRFLQTLAGGDLFGAVAREVVEAYGDQIHAHPVGTGPFRLADWRRSSKIVLERNPNYREHLYDAEPNADDAEGQELVARFRGRRLPMIDRVEISIIEEQQPRWLAFLQKSQDLMERLPNEFVNLAIPNNRLAPNLAREGVRMYRTLAADVTITIYNMDDPVLGGYTPEKVALRRALNLATNTEQEIRLERKGQAIPAQSPLVPHTFGYDPQFRSENGDYDPARAKALLDMYGYVDRDGDGWREQPDGQPLVLRVATQPDQASRRLDELQRKDWAAIGIRTEFVPAKWPENLKNARAGKLMIWRVGSSAAAPDGQPALYRSASVHIGGQNLARFRNEQFDRLFQKMSVLPDGPERLALFAEAKKIITAYAPYKHGVHRILTDLAHPWLIGFRRPPYWLHWWQYVDIDAEAQARAVE